MTKNPSENPKGQDVEQLELLYTAAGHKNGPAILENSLAISSKHIYHTTQEFHS